MFFLMQARHHPDMDATRDALRPAHRDWNRSGGNGMVSVLTGGPGPCRGRGLRRR